MTDASNPKQTFNIIPANTAVKNAAQRCLVLCQKLTAGTATVNQLYVDVEDDAIAGLGGTGSMGADFLDAYRVDNDVTPLDYIFIDDASGTQAQGTITFDGVATENGELTITCGSERNGKAVVTVLNTDTSDDVATAVAAAYVALLDKVCAVTVDGVTTDQVNFDYLHDGTEGNSTVLKVSGSVAGITYTIVGFTGGAGAPTVPDVSAIVGNQRYQTVCGPGALGTSWITTLLDARWNVVNRIQDGVGVVTVADTAGNTTTALGLLNSQSLIYQAEGTESESDYDGPSLVETLFARSAEVAAVRALRLTAGANIVELVNAAGGPNDATGGPHIASLPYFNTPLPLPVMKAGYGFSDTEVASIETAGGFIAGNNDAATGIVLGGIPTTYKTDAQGSPDTSFKYLNYVDTISNVREYMFNNMKKACRQSRLTNGDLIAGYNMNNVASINAKYKRFYQTLSGPGYVLTQAGPDAVKFFEDNLSTVIDLETGLATSNMKVAIVTQLRTIIANIQIAFSPN